MINDIRDFLTTLFSFLMANIEILIQIITIRFLIKDSHNKEDIIKKIVMKAEI